jgi:hypothetical protein
LRGVESEIITAAAKNAMYSVEFPNMNRIAGSVGLKLGAMGECPGLIMLGMGMIGGCD